MKQVLLGIATALLLVPGAQADVRISEWMYAGSGGEFVEFTNFGTSAVDFTGWSFDDDSRLPGVLNLSAFGLVGVGESVIITETDADIFRSYWGLASSVKVIGEYTNNLGRNDEINLYNASNQLVDRLTYGDQSFAGSIRTQNISGTPTSAAALGANNPLLWQFSAVGNADGAWVSATGDIGSPGFSALAPVPEASTWLMMVGGLGLLGFAARRKA